MKKIILIFILCFSMTVFTEPLRKISVTGNSEKEVMPDIAKIRLRVYTKNEDVKKAGKENEANLEKFKSDLKKNNISISSLETTNYFTQKTTEATKKQDEKTEYVTTLFFSINVNDLTKVPDLIDLSEKNYVKNLKSDNVNKNLYYAGINRSNSQKDASISNTFKIYDNMKSQLSKLGISGNDISIYSYSTESRQVKSDKPQKNKEVHNVYNDFILEIKDISKINEVIRIAEDNKINVQGNIVFDISNKDEIESELYNIAYEQTKTKASSILKSSDMSLGEPLVISESIAYQNVAVKDVSYYASGKVTKDISPLMENEIRAERSMVQPVSAPVKVDYKPQILKLTQNVSVLFEIK